jgi:hypothetical protein
MLQRNINRTTPKIQRTSIDDLSAVGYELAEESLRLAAGGRCTHYELETYVSKNLYVWDGYED